MKHTSAKVALALGASTLLVALSGCSSTTDAANTATSAGSNNGGAKQLAIAGATLADPFQVVLYDEVEANATKAGFTALPPTNADADAAKQVADIQNLLVQKPSAIITVPIDADAIVPAIATATQAGVPVVTVDRAPSSGDVYMVVRADNYGMGQDACEAIGKAIGGTGTVLNLQGALTSSAGLERSNGFTDCMTKDFPNIEVDSQPTDWDSEKAAAATQTVVGTKDVKAIFMASDSAFTDPVSATLKNLNKWVPAGQDGHVVIATVDGTSAALDMVRQGYFDTVVSQPVNLYAQYAVQYANDAVEGKEAPAEGDTDHDSRIVVDNGIRNDLLQATVVTKDNVDESTLWGNAKQ